MNQVDEGLLSETEGNEELDDPKFVHISESIKYRKRAQSAEKKAETLAQELSAAKTQIAQVTEQLDSASLEQKLVKKLVAAGAVDLETACLVAKETLGSKKDDADLDSCIEQLKKQKQFLFAQGIEQNFPKKTAGERSRESTGPKTLLERAAKKAAQTGARNDLQEYLRLRRNIL